MGALLRTLVPELSCLESDGLVHHCGEVGEDMQSEGRLELLIESFTELLLPTCIIWEVSTRIAREVEEFPLICLNRFSALNEVVELGLHPVHDRLRDVTS